MIFSNDFMRIYLFAFFFILVFISHAQTPKSGGLVLPTRQQLAWHETEYYLFMHFGPNTFTGKEWGDGTEPEDLFNPTELDCNQWCKVAKESGAKGIIITAKHHDGFCLWPSKFSTHTVRESKWRNGEGDVLKELSQACRANGLKFGVYLSPWDRNHPKYGTPSYNDVFVNMMKEIIQNYGPIWEMWWDGANGEGTNKKQEYDWRRFETTVRQFSPRTLIFSDIGPDIRWVGNENGIAGETNWNFLDTAGFKRGAGAPPVDTLNRGNANGRFWIPAESDVSIRPGWFWREEENAKVKTAKELFTIYLKSVGRGSNLLLNVPPDSRGVIQETDILALKEFKRLRDQNFSENLLKDASTFYEFSQRDLSSSQLTFRGFDSVSAGYGINLQNFIVEMPRPTRMNTIVLREAIHLGQTIRRFRIVLYEGRKIVREISGTSIGRKRIVTFPSTNVTSFKVFIEDAKGNDNIMGIGAFLVEEALLDNSRE
jgi:alpha-L-fucosidase